MDKMQELFEKMVNITYQAREMGEIGMVTGDRIDKVIDEYEEYFFKLEKLRKWSISEFRRKGKVSKIEFIEFAKHLFPEKSAEELEYMGEKIILKEASNEK